MGRRAPRLAGLLVALLLLAAPAGVARAESVAAVGPAALAPPTVLLDGLRLNFDVPPTIVSGRTLVPVRVIAEALGMQVAWDPDARRVTASGQGQSVVLFIDRTDAYVNGKPALLDVPATIVGGRTLVPLRFFSGAFGAGVGWDDATRTVLLTSPPRAMHLEAFYAIQAFDQRGLIPRFNRADFGWSRLRADGTIDLQGKDFFWPEAAGSVTPESILADAAQAGTGRYLMVFATDTDGGLTHLLGDDKLIAAAAQNVAAMVAAKGFDGALLDLEGLGWVGDATTNPLQVQARFNKLVDAAAQALHQQGKGLALALHPLNSAYKGYDYAHIGATADSIVIMAYDYRSDRGPEPLDLVDAAVRLALAQGVATGKLVLGINVYHEDGTSLPQKLGIAKRYGLKGAALWRLGLVTDDELAALQASVIMRQ